MLTSSLGGFDWSWVYALDTQAVLALLFVGIPLLTYLTTWGQHILAECIDDVEPPPVPYWIPFLGNIIPFGLDPGDYLKKLQRRFGRTPLTIRLGPSTKLYLIPNGSMLQAVFKNTRELSTKIVEILALQRQFGLPDADVALWWADDSGVGAQPAEGVAPDRVPSPEKRLFHRGHRDLQSYLTGPALAAVAARFVDAFAARLSGDSSFEQAGDGGWVAVPDLAVFVRDAMLASGIDAVCGEHFLRVNPGFVDDFWAFDAAIPLLFRTVPKWMFRRGYAARQRCMDAVKRWHAYAEEHFDWGDAESVEADWEPIYGARLLRARVQMGRDVGLTPDGMAAYNLAVIWAANVNVATATVWSLIDIVSTPGLSDRILAESAPCFPGPCPPPSPPALLRLDLARLSSLPLLTSVYMEELRVRGSSASVRQPLAAQGFRMGKWRFRREGLLFSPAWLGARDVAFWNEGGEREAHPVDGFWAERFLAYPGDERSGPIRKGAGGDDAGPPGGDKAEGRWEREPSGLARRFGVAELPPLQPAEEAKKTAADDARARLVTAGIQAHWFPYGGGLKICPGRFLAKQQMMAAVAMFLRAYEVDVVNGPAVRRLGPDMTRFAFGALPPDGKVPARIRRRRGVV